MANDPSTGSTTTPASLPTDSETNEGSMKPLTKEQVEKVPGAGAPTEDEAEGDAAADHEALEKETHDRRL